MKFELEILDGFLSGIRILQVGLTKVSLSSSQVTILMNNIRALWHFSFATIGETNSEVNDFQWYEVIPYYSVAARFWGHYKTLTERITFNLEHSGKEKEEGRASSTGG